MPHKYDKLAAHLSGALDELKALGMRPSLSKGTVGEILLARELCHEVNRSQGGADGIGPDGKHYEYKVSHDNQFNFNFGHARGNDTVEALVDKHFNGFEGAYCGLMEGAEITKIVYCDAKSLAAFLREHLTKVKGSTFQKVFSPIERFAALPNAIWIKGKNA